MLKHQLYKLNPKLNDDDFEYAFLKVFNIYINCFQVPSINNRDLLAATFRLPEYQPVCGVSLILAYSMVRVNLSDLHSLILMVCQVFPLVDCTFVSIATE
jgi:hypothetical protein